MVSFKLADRVRRELCLEKHLLNEFLAVQSSALVESKQEMELSLFESAKEVPILELVCGLADTTIPHHPSPVLGCFDLHKLFNSFRTEY